MPFAAGSALLASGFTVHEVLLFEWAQYIRSGCLHLLKVAIYVIWHPPLRLLLLYIHQASS